MSDPKTASPPKAASSPKAASPEPVKETEASPPASPAKAAAIDSPATETPAPAAETPIPAAETGSNQEIAVDTAEDTESYLDSLYGDSTRTETTSLASSIMAHRYENGRRYHAYQEGAYWAPNDETQNDQLDMYHHIAMIVLDGALFLAPIGENPQRILDLGTGTGIWAIDVADQFPSAIVTGTDLSPTQPSWVPPNCRFEIDDFNLEWTFPANTFDLIHSRTLYGSVNDFLELYKHSLNALRPGGWHESYESTIFMVSNDNSVPDPCYFNQWVQSLADASAASGKDFNVAHKQRGYIEQAGFVNVVERKYTIPLAPWPKDKKLKEIGVYARENLLTGMEGFTMALYTRVLGWKSEDVHVFLEKIRKELKNPKIHGYITVYVVYGQKPKN